MTAFDPRITAARPDLAADFLEGKIEALRYAPGTEMQVSAAVLDLRSAPDRDAMLATQLLHGEGFTVYEERPDGFAWGQSTRDGYVGYVGAAGLSTPGPTANVQVSALMTHIYGHPDMKTKVLSQLPFLSRLTRDGITSNFAVIGEDRYCPQQHLSPIGALGDDFVAITERFLGAPYLWGGRTMLGIDCSGLVQIALQATGEKPPRDSDMFAVLGGAIDMSAILARGDLILWKGHIGIMRDKETILHANAHSMSVASEPLSVVKSRIAENGFGEITACRRL